MDINRLVLLILTIKLVCCFKVEASISSDQRLESLRSVGLKGRTINFLFRNMLSKPRVSPLYLLDGTVCRFVNFQPVCTTLSTTGVLRGGAAGGGGARPGGASGGGGSGGGGSGGAGGGSASGGAAGGNRGGSSSGGGGGGAGGASGGQRPGSSGVMSSGSSVQFVSPQNQLLRPASMMDDDPQDLSVDSTSNLTETSMINRDQQPVMATTATVATRPLNFVVSRRRPVNLLPFRRPAIIRPIQVVGRETPTYGGGRLSSIKP